MIRGRRPLTVAAATGASLLLVGAPALAFWTLSGAGMGTASSGSLAAPTGGVAAAAGPGALSLSWEPPSPTPTGYVVTNATAGAPGCTSTGPSCTVTGLDEGVAYTFTVVAQLGQWRSPASAPFGAASGQTDAVTIVSATPSPLALTDASTVLKWRANVNGPYSVRVGGTTCTTGTQVAAGGGSYTTQPAIVETTILRTELADGTNTIRVCVGSISATTTVTKAAVATGPAALAAPTLAPTSDTGSSQSDGITNDTTPTFTGSGAVALSTITLYDGSTAIGSGTATATGGYSITVGTLTDGARSITAKQTTATGTSPSSAGTGITIDTVRPKASDIQTSNGATGGKIDPDDVVTFTFDEAVDPAFIAAGWDGSATSVTVKFKNSNSGISAQRLEGVTTGTNPVALGSLRWDQSYMAGGNNGEGSASATMTLSADKKSVTIKLSQSPQHAATTAVTSSSTLTLTPATGPRDLAGNELTSVTVVNESGAADVDW